MKLPIAVWKLEGGGHGEVFTHLSHEGSISIRIRGKEIHEICYHDARRLADALHAAAHVLHTRAEIRHEEGDHTP